ncbi:UNVERIFIED_ORG: hypothetical protein ABIC48_002036 [Burkholderia territorii]
MLKVGDKVRNVRDGRSNWFTRGFKRIPAVGDVCTVVYVSKCGRYIALAEYLADAPEHKRNAHSYEKITAEHTGFDLLAAMTGKPLKFRSGCDVKFIAYSPEAKPHCQLVLLNPSTGNIVTRYANGKASDEPHNDPGDILVKEAA